MILASLSRLLRLCAITPLASGAWFGMQAAQSPVWVFSCAPSNDLYRAVATAQGQPPPRFDQPLDAIHATPPGGAVLILADGYPERTTPVTGEQLVIPASKGLRMYLEYPDSLPGLVVGPPRQAGKERGVVTSDFFGPELEPGRIVALSGCWYVPVDITNAPLVLAQVAGVDSAVFGLKDTASHPLLIERVPGRFFVGTTRLSQFVTGRCLPSEAWRQIWQTILHRLQPDAPAPTLAWLPTVRPTLSQSEPLPAGIEKEALRRSANWIVSSRVLRHPDWPAEVLDWSRTYNTVREMPKAEWPIGDGSLGLLEGFSSTIHRDGRQPMRFAVRNDCLTEVAMLMAFDGDLNQQGSSTCIATNLVDYLFDRSGLAAGPRANPRASSYGLIGWALDSPDSYWGDDNARAILALAAVSALTGNTRHNDAVARCVLANFRTTGVTGYREECVTEPALSSRGWTNYWTGRHVKYSPHFESWLWPCFLWAYDQTRFEPLLTRTRTGARMLMEAYPDQWFWCIRSGSIELARALLPLAWLVRVEDTPEHRAWLRRIAGDLVALQDASGAIREMIGDGGPGTASNAEYGTRETTLIQTNGDPVCDLLYTCNFALIGLHEAAAATGDPFYREAEDRLAAFLCRIQIRSEAHPELDGAWYRAFDFRRWEYWASNADWEWGPWCTETGWSQPWIAGTLGLRQRQTSLWDLVRSTRIGEAFQKARPHMLPDAVLETAPPQARHQARHAKVTLASRFDGRYPGGGPAGLVDGFLAEADYRDPGWQGYVGTNLVVTLELNAVRSLRSIEARFLQQLDVGIFLPVQVQFATSVDGTTWESHTPLPFARHDRESGPLIETIRTEMPPRPARFIRVEAQTVGRMPAWHPQAPGQPAWLFVDEILVDPDPRPSF